MLWDILQQMQLGSARDHAISLEERIEELEYQMERNNKVLVEVIRYLEEKEGRDLDGDGKVG